MPRVYSVTLSDWGSDEEEGAWAAGFANADNPSIATPVPTIAVVFRKSRLDVDIRMGSLLIYLPLAWGRVTVFRAGIYRFKSMCKDTRMSSMNWLTPFELHTILARRRRSY